MNYLNQPHCKSKFQDTRNGIYIDKSDLINKTNSFIRTQDKYLCITRPRRFGKTINANMLGAYYTKGLDSQTLFDNLSITKYDTYEKHLNKHNVIFIDFSQLPDGCNSYDEYITSIRKGLKDDLIEAYPKLANKEYDRLDKVFSDTNDSFIFIMDEWDSIFYKEFMQRKDKIAFLGFLKGLLKDQHYVELAYMTGVLPIAKYSSGSELNMFREYNFMNDPIYESYFGFHEEEVKALCETFTTIPYEELKYWYDGYYMQDGRSLFNPKSVCCALSDGICSNYWTATGPMDEIAHCIEHNVDAVREDIVQMIAGNPVRIKLRGYSAIELQLNTRDEILSAMVVYGFLSYHDGYLRIPNHELMEKFQDVVARPSMNDVANIVKQSEEVLNATLAMDEKRVCELLEEAHNREIPFLKYNDENSLSCVITLCYLYARDFYDMYREEKSGKGFCDYIFYPKKSDMPGIIIELKVHQSCEDALQQIKNKQYQNRLQNCKEILLVGINYDDAKHHTCLIEKICKEKQ